MVRRHRWTPVPFPRLVAAGLALVGAMLVFPAFGSLALDAAVGPRDAGAGVVSHANAYAGIAVSSQTITCSDLGAGTIRNVLDVTDRATASLSLTVNETADPANIAGAPNVDPPEIDVGETANVTVPFNRSTCPLGWQNVTYQVDAEHTARLRARIANVVVPVNIVE